jgi:hypothetical protein
LIKKLLPKEKKNFSELMYHAQTVIARRIVRKLLALDSTVRLTDEHYQQAKVKAETVYEQDMSVFNFEGGLTYNLWDLIQEVYANKYTKEYVEVDKESDGEVASEEAEESYEKNKKKRKQQKLKRKEIKKGWVELGSFWDQWRDEAIQINNNDRDKLRSHYILLQDRLLELMGDDCEDCDEFKIEDDEYENGAKWWDKRAYPIMIEWVEDHSDHRWEKKLTREEKQAIRQAEYEKKQAQKLKEEQESVEKWIRTQARIAKTNENKIPGTIDRLIAKLMEIKGAAFIDEDEDANIGEEPEEDDNIFAKSYNKTLKHEKHEQRASASASVAPSVAGVIATAPIKTKKAAAYTTIPELRERCKDLGIPVNDKWGKKQLDLICGNAHRVHALLEKGKLTAKEAEKITKLLSEMDQTELMEFKERFEAKFKTIAIKKGGARRFSSPRLR